MVIRYLLTSAKVVKVYRPNFPKLIARLEHDAAKIKDILVTTIASKHPDRPYHIEAERYQACRLFLANFKNIYTLNYDVLLYWALMQQEIDDLNLTPDDGFRHPEDDPDVPYVSWQEANQSTVHYLHGALHLFDTGAEITKYTWSKTDIPIVDQIRQALDEDKFPLFVAEGTSQSKRERIMHSAYLHKALRSFEGVCRSPGNAIFVFGHSLDDNDRHIFRYIERGGVKQMFVSLFGDRASVANKKIIQTALAMRDRRGARGARYPLDVIFYDAASAQVWG